MAIPKETAAERPSALDRSPRTLDEADIEPLEEDDRVGLTLRETYNLVRVAGEGGMARVYEARHTRISAKRFAVKVLRSDFSTKDEVALRFRREAEAIAAISHPNVLEVHDVGETPDGRPYIVTEYLEGMDLSTLIDRDQRLSAILAVRIGRQVARGVEAAHSRGVIHRDLKPENVFLCGDLESPLVKVLDFGLARVLDTDDTNLTRTGIVMGTPAYMSPEQARGERADHRADIYGTGAVLYAALTGRPPFEEETAQLAVLAVMAKEPQRPRSLTPSIPPALEVVVQRAMARDPAERYASAQELESALAAVESLLTVPELDLAMRPATRAEQRSIVSIHEDDAEGARSRLVAIMAGGLALLVLALAMAVTSGLELLVQRAPSGFELTLVALGILGTVATPALLVFRSFRRRIWNNSARVLELVGSMRTALIFGLSSYGLCLLAVRIHDLWLSRSLGAEQRALFSGWLGWDVVFFVAAALAAVSGALRSTLLRMKRSWWRRALVGPLVVAVSVLGAVALLQVGFSKRPHASSTTPALARAEKARGEPPAAPATAQKPGPATPEKPVVEAADAGSSTTAAPSELDEARDKGLAGWLALKERYPSDPDVLKPLALAYAEDDRTAQEAVSTLKQLFEVRPSEQLDKKLHTILVKIALRSDTDAAGNALDVMGTSMGPAGPNLLYDLYLTSPALREPAKARLADEGVRKFMTPALSIAFDLRVAPSCAARVPMLPRAEREGDERSIAVLSLLGNRTKSGCGYKKRRPCAPPCAAQSAQFVQTSGKIRQRLSKN